MSDKYKTLNFGEDHGDSLLDESTHLEELMETEDHREKPTEDALGDFVCRDWDIFLQDSLTDSQLECMVKSSTLVDSAVPLRDLETAKALEPSNLDWYRNVWEESDLVESHDSQVREKELAVDPCLPSPEPVQDMDTLVEVVQQWSNHSELCDNVQEILLEA